MNQNQGKPYFLFNVVPRNNVKKSAKKHSNVKIEEKRHYTTRATNEY